MMPSNIISNSLLVQTNTVPDNVASRRSSQASLIETPYVCQNLPSYRAKKTMLPSSFQPKPYSVIMGRGKEASNAVGNRRLRVLVETQLDKYLKAKSRKEKSFVVAHVLETVQQACPEGAFIKHDGKNWWEVDDNTAREKIGAMFRDRLHNHYKSSTKAKLARRRASKVQGQSGSSVSTSATEPASNPSSEEFEPLPINEPQNIMFLNKMMGGT